MRIPLHFTIFFARVNVLSVPLQQTDSYFCSKSTSTKGLKPSTQISTYFGYHNEQFFCISLPTSERLILQPRHSVTFLRQFTIKSQQHFPISRNSTKSCCVAFNFSLLTFFFLRTAQKKLGGKF